MLRAATENDVGAIEALMRASVRGLFPAFEDATRTAAAADWITRLDPLLIDDGTYFVTEDDTGLTGCGGWSRRARLHAGTGGPDERDLRLLDPATEPARIRAMFVRPDRARRGLGRELLGTAEAAARAEGFDELILMATLPGVPLYTALGFTSVEETSFATPTGVALRGAVMRKSLRRNGPGTDTQNG